MQLSNNFLPVAAGNKANENQNSINDELENRYGFVQPYVCRTATCSDFFSQQCPSRQQCYPPGFFVLVHVCVGALTEVEGHRRVVVCFAVSDEVDLVLPLLLL